MGAEPCLDLDFEVRGPAIGGRFKAGRHGRIDIDGTVNGGGVIVMKRSFVNFRGTIDATSGAGKGKFDTAFGCGGLFELKRTRRLSVGFDFGRDAGRRSTASASSIECFC